MPTNRTRAVLMKRLMSMTRHSYPSLAHPVSRRGRGLWDTVVKYGSEALGSLASSALSGLKEGVKGAIPGALKSVGEWLTAPSEKEAAEALRKEHEKEAAEARRKQDLEFELEERRLSAEEKRKEAAEAKAEREKEELARRHAPSEQSVTQSRGQAELQVRKWKERYPTVFQQFPQYGTQLVQKVLGALLAPENPADPLAVQKTLGDIELNLSQTEGRLNPRGAEAKQHAPDLRSLGATSQYRTSRPSKRDTASSAGRGAPLGLCSKAGRTGGGIVGVLRA